MNRTLSRAALRWEIAIVLALSLGASAVYSIVSLIDVSTRDSALAQQTTTIHRSLAHREIFDLIYQLLGVATGLAPVALVVFLLWSHRPPHLRALGFSAPMRASLELGGAGSRLFGLRDGAWWLRESAWGLVLAAAIGVPGLAFYAFSRAIGINTAVVPAALAATWWTVPVLVLQALQAALSEELIVVAYLFARLKQLGWRPWAVILASALLRGSYHLYQGFGAGVGNVVMGAVFGWCYHRFGRALPLVIAHWVLDIVSFVGYPLAHALWPALM